VQISIAIRQVHRAISASVSTSVKAQPEAHQEEAAAPPIVPLNCGGRLEKGERDCECLGSDMPVAAVPLLFLFL
jgi:hypothetical protein